MSQLKKRKMVKRQSPIIYTILALYETHVSM